MYHIYKVADTLNNKVYIGQTVDAKKRWASHKSFAKNPERTGQHIHRAMAKYGVENFIYEIILCCKTQEDTDESERLLIIQYDSRNKEHGYNVAPGGEHAWNKGLPKERRPMYGKKQSEFCKQKNSEIRKGSNRPCSEETKKKMSEAHSGKKHSKERNDKAVRSRLNSINGYNHTEESKKKMSAARIGKYAGENHPRAKLTWDIIRNMRADYMNGMKRIDISKKYSVSKTSTGQIVLNQIWIE